MCVSSGGREAGTFTLRYLTTIVRYFHVLLLLLHNDSEANILLFLLHYISFTFHIDTDVYTDILMGHSQATQQIKPQEAVKPNLQV